MVSTQRIAELKAAFNSKTGWELVDFLDTVNSVSELEEVVLILEDEGRKIHKRPDYDRIAFYRANLVRWPEPKLKPWFKREFPLVSARLDTPQKIRIFLRGADFRNVSMAVMASVFEDIIKKHEVDGQNVIRYERYRGNAWCDALRIVYHTQIQARALTNLMLPGRTSSGTRIGGDDAGLYIDWRSEEEIEAEKRKARMASDADERF